jgi:hypothetical protein
MITESVTTSPARPNEFRAVYDFGVVDPMGRRIGVEVNILFQSRDLSSPWAFRPAMTRNGSLFGRALEREYRNFPTMEAAHEWAVTFVQRTASRYGA